MVYGMVVQRQSVEFLFLWVSVCRFSTVNGSHKIYYNICRLRIKLLALFNMVDHLCIYRVYFDKKKRANEKQTSNIAVAAMNDERCHFYERSINNAKAYTRINM